jgi:hypothetical protein
MKNWTLERITNLVLIVSCVFSVTVMAHRLTRSDNSTSPTAPGLTRGSRAPILENVDYRRHKETVVMFIRSSCKFCTDSMPLYRRLAHETASDIQFVAASAEPTTVTQDYLRSHGVTIDTIVTAAQVVPTPTVLLVNRSGIIEQTWVGWL